MLPGTGRPSGPRTGGVDARPRDRHGQRGHREAEHGRRKRARHRSDPASRVAVWRVVEPSGEATAHRCAEEQRERRDQQVEPTTQREGEDAVRVVQADAVDRGADGAGPPDLEGDAVADDRGDARPARGRTGAA